MESIAAKSVEVEVGSDKVSGHAWEARLAVDVRAT